MSNADTMDQAIAIVGLVGRFPQSRDLDTFWRHLAAGDELIRFFSEEELLAAGVHPATLRNPAYVNAFGALDDTDLFDATAFGYTPREAEIMDPQHRFFLECAWAALEDAGYDPDRYPGLIGVFAGSNISTYLLFNLAANREVLASVGLYQTLIGNDKDHLTLRTSYKLNLRGPSVTVQTTCSTSLVATHLACQSLLNGECDMALAGGVSIGVPQNMGYWYSEGGIMSPDGHCRAFSAEAQGTVGGHGIGIVVLKRLADALEDGDGIRAVIRGSAINNDGTAKVGYTAPSVEAQAAVIEEAQAIAGVDPDTISYIEAHGTGTTLGDPIEITALTQAFRAQTDQTGFCALGSVKTNIGHLDAAAGVTGLIKTVLALQHRQLPPSLHCQQTNPRIDFARSPFFVNTALREWRSDGPRRAGVSSFGMGGTNAHVIVEEAPQPEPSGPSRPWQVLTLSAKTPTALDTATANLGAHLRRHPDLNLADVAFTLGLGRRVFSQRRFLVCRDVADAMTALESRDPTRIFSYAQEQQRRPVAFLFSGQGTQYPGMARALYAAEPTFQETVDRCCELLQPDLGIDLRTLLYGEADSLSEAAAQLEQTALTQPALFVIEYALAQLWMSWGVRPDALIGHSIGEYVAATLAGVFSLEDALALVALRGRMIQALPSGAMLSVPLPEQEVAPLLGPELSLAAVNGPALCVVSGPAAAIDELERQLGARDLATRRLHTSHAFHSAMMEPIVAPFAEQVGKLRLSPPALPFISNVTGTWIAPEQATDPRYWARHLRHAVRFADGLAVLLQEPERILLEVGPGRALSTIARQHPDPTSGRTILSSLPHAQDEADDLAFVLGTLGKLWLAGASVDWERFYADEQRQRVPLPTYPFERQRYWVDPQSQGLQLSANAAESQAELPPSEPQITGPAAVHPRPSLMTEYVAPDNEFERSIAAIWQEILGIEQVGVHDNFFDLGGHSLLATQLIARLREAFPVDLPLSRLFDAVTVASQAEVIEELLIEKLEELPEEEAQRLMAKMFR
ncbi:MAG TPA: beta-ketoacyl synthase N-terminal-like domain-containing protein [Herpetosiphonaceae bacterium]